MDSSKRHSRQQCRSGYGDSSGKTHAFLYNGINWNIFSYPGALATSAFGIYGNRIVGWYNIDNHSGQDHGFIYDGTNWTTLDAPGALETEAYGIDGKNIVGAYSDGSGSHGFIYDGTNWTTLDAPGATTTDASGIYDHSVVGPFVDGSGIHGFVYTITETNPPVIIRQPTASQTVAVGSTVTLSVVATNGPLSYQWYFGTNVLVGDTNPDLTLTNLQSSQSGTYTVTVSNVVSTVTSDAAALSILPSLNIYMVPGISINATVGTTNELQYEDVFGPTNAWLNLTNVVITNNPQWYFDTSAIGQPQRFYQLVHTN